MNLFQLILKQMRQRLLSTCLTTLSILLGMTLATSVLILEREGQNVFAQSDFGYDMIVGPKASPLQIVFNTVYHLDVSPGNIPYALYDQLAGHPAAPPTNGTTAPAPSPYRGKVAWAVPIAVGDSYQGRPIVGTSASFFGFDDQGQPLPPESTPHFRKDQTFSFSEGHVFAPNKFEAVIGSEVAKKLGLKIGNHFQATHGFPGPTDRPDIHDESWTIVGILNETHTANDRCLFIPILTFYAIFEHEAGEEAIAKVQNGTQPATPATKPPPAAAEEKAYVEDPVTHTITVKLPKPDWQLSAILVQSRSPTAAIQIQFTLRNLPDAIAVLPAPVMRNFFNQFLPKTTTLLIAISTLVTIVGGISILVSIYNSVTARNREIAIMRALGATRGKILAIICLEAGLVATIGGILGLIGGHLLAAGASFYLQQILGTGIPWWRASAVEWLYFAIVLAIGLLAGLAPARKAYQTPVAENLVTV